MSSDQLETRSAFVMHRSHKIEDEFDIWQTLKSKNYWRETLQWQNKTLREVNLMADALTNKYMLSHIENNHRKKTISKFGKEIC